VLQPYRGSAETEGGSMGAIETLSFNPTEVLLKRSRTGEAVAIQNGFNPTEVLLKQSLQSEGEVFRALLQPYRGSAETKGAPLL